jgi:acyl-CoA synthetase (AMP-forming)/AMP-acid ligase II
VPHEDTVSNLDRVLRLDSGARALQFSGQWLTYGELTTQIDATRDALRAAGVVAGSPVATVLPNRPDGLVAMLAVLLERACVVTISPRLSAQELQRVDVQAVVGPAPLVPQGAAIRGADTLAVVAHGAAPPVPGVAVLMATSGTTGAPKRIPITSATVDSVVSGVRSLARGTPASIGLRDDTTLICFPYTSLSGFIPQLIALVSGRRTALLERFEPRAVAALVAEHGMTSLALNPTAMRMLLDSDDVDPASLASVRYVRSGSAPLSAELAARFEERFGVRVLQSYGQTEVGGEVVGWSPDDHRAHGVDKRGSVGRPHAGVDVEIVRPGDQPGRPLPPDEVGELWLRGARNVSGWHRTGDLARVDGDGFVWIEGRSDGVIICGGFNIVPAVVEKVLERHPAVAEAAVVPRADERLGEVPVAVVVPAAGATCDERALIDLCRDELEPYQLPRAIVVVDDLPRNEIGKVHLAALREIASMSDAPV